MPQLLILSFAAAPPGSLRPARSISTPPGRCSPERLRAPLQPRAVAPPWATMARGSLLLRNPSFVNVQGPSVTDDAAQRPGQRTP